MLIKPVVVNVRNVDRNAPGVEYIGRGSKWGNPFRLRKEADRNRVIREYAHYILKQPALLRAIEQGELDGKRLACYCRPKRCHGDVLVCLWQLLRGGMEGGA